MISLSSKTACAGSCGIRVLSSVPRTRSVGTRVVVVRAKQSKWSSESDLYDPSIAVEAPTSTYEGSGDGLPLYITVPGGFLALLTCSRLVGAIMRRSRRNALEERGFKRDSAADEDHYSRMMKGMKTVRYDDLTSEQMEAARRRRQREVSNDSFDIDNLELPSNHPFAVKQEVTPEEEALQRQRLNARRGLSAQDLELLKKTQEMADDLDR